MDDVTDAAPVAAPAGNTDKRTRFNVPRIALGACAAFLFLGSHFYVSKPSWANDRQTAAINLPIRPSALIAPAVKPAMPVSMDAIGPMPDAAPLIPLAATQGPDLGAKNRPAEKALDVAPQPVAVEGRHRRVHLVHRISTKSVQAAQTAVPAQPCVHVYPELGRCHTPDQGAAASAN
jgi:hypothetical protein